MSKVDYSDDIKGAEEEIRDSGILVTWVEPSQASPSGGHSWDDDTGSAGNPTNYANTPVVIIPINRIGFEGLLAILGTEVSTSHQFALLPGNVPFVPSNKGVFITPDNVRYAVVTYDVYKPGGDPILYVIKVLQE